jgi:hypothetical protein
MNWKFWQEKESIFDEQIAEILTHMNATGPGTQEYAELLQNLERLTSMKEKSKNIMRVSPDTIAVVAGNLLGILIIVAYEQNHALTSKGMNFVKPKNP